MHESQTLVSPADACQLLSESVDCAKTQEHGIANALLEREKNVRESHLRHSTADLSILAGIKTIIITAAYASTLL
jgi:hypothetical protein